MPSPCCTNCRTKYSLRNPEEGCSNCALSFCRRCLPHRAILPQLADKPVTVCSQCFEKLNAETLKNQSRNGTQITHIRIDDLPQRPSSSANNVQPSNWWGDGLPPPSMRQSIGTLKCKTVDVSRSSELLLLRSCAAYLEEENSGM
ncbi:hypothetical protein ANCCAN_20917 [Ancylostoma caninum]|uniref:FYVE-type domain-containing protein n=1 Tax=Ancylostoma caninum TaxID=29170 RepID=A0A368FSP9_ANCCA|nr:hypothetical protein ANCCAN_20917 [Ancylostoma caninum]